MSDQSSKRAHAVPGELLFVGLFLLFSLFLLVRMPDQVKWFNKTKWSAQPALWPSVGVIGMAVFGGLHFYTRFRKDNWRREWAEAAVWLRAFEFVGWFMLYVYSVPVIGYLPATLIMAPVLAFRMGYRSGRMLWSAAGVGFAIVLLFKAFLQVKIPGAMIYEYLPGGLRSFMILNF
jgi:hypothetical protein